MDVERVTFEMRDPFCIENECGFASIGPSLLFRFLFLLSRFFFSFLG
jgi:hypothetical protein